MSFTYIFIFITYCGLLGIFLRCNYLNVVVSLLQITIGINGLFAHENSLIAQRPFSVYLIIFLIFTFIIFMQAIAMLMIKRRSTLQVNELTELRG